MSQPRDEPAVDGAWWRVAVDLPLPLAEVVAWRLASELGCVTEVQDESTMTAVSGGDARVVVGLESAPDDAFRAALANALASVGHADAPVQTARETDDSWKTGWRAFFRGARVSDRFWVRPPWEADDPAAEYTIIVDPGLAFGTGTHDTTRGVLRVLDRLLAERPGVPLVDVGAGSAILSIAAAHLGRDALGVELDPVAVESARGNLELNGVADRVELRVGSVETVDGEHPLVVANILATILIEIAEPLAAISAADLLLSGMLHREVEAVRAAYPDFDLVARSDEGEWAILHLRRR